MRSIFSALFRSSHFVRQWWSSLISDFYSLALTSFIKLHSLGYCAFQFSNFCLISAVLYLPVELRLEWNSPCHPVWPWNYVVPTFLSKWQDSECVVCPVKANFVVCFYILGINPRDLCIQGKCLTTFPGPHPLAFLYIFYFFSTGISCLAYLKYIYYHLLNFYAKDRFLIHPDLGVTGKWDGQCFTNVFIQALSKASVWKHTLNIINSLLQENLTGGIKMNERRTLNDSIGGSTTV